MLKDHGVLIAPPRPKDFILGGANGISIDREIHNWGIYLPAVEKQYSDEDDFLICTTMSGPDHSLATQLNYLLFTNQLSDEALYFFHNAGYIKDGLFSLSSRFNAKLNGTEKTKGQYMNVAADCVRRDGFIPEIDWPTTENMSWTEFYNDIPIGLFSKGRKALWFIDIKYQWINKTDLAQALKVAPVQVASRTCPGWDTAPVVPKCTGNVLNHATMVYAQNTIQNWLDLDHYSPFKKVLAADYELPYNLQYVVTVKPLTLRNGMHGSNVLQLQKDLNKLGFFLKEDANFGPKTEIQVKSFQNKTGLKPDGIAGPLTLSKLKELTTPRSLLDAMILVESGGDDYAEGDTGLVNHAYGCLQIRQGVCDDVNRIFNTDYIAQDCLGHRQVSLDIWHKYWKVYPLIVTNEDRARTWNGGPGWKKIYFKPNKTEKEKQYCKNLDIYWEKVEKLLN